MRKYQHKIDGYRRLLKLLSQPISKLDYFFASEDITEFITDNLNVEKWLKDFIEDFLFWNLPELLNKYDKSHLITVINKNNHSYYTSIYWEVQFILLKKIKQYLDVFREAYKKATKSNGKFKRLAFYMRQVDPYIFDKIFGDWNLEIDTPIISARAFNKMYETRLKKELQ